MSTDAPGSARSCSRRPHGNLTKRDSDLAESDQSRLTGKSAAHQHSARCVLSLAGATCQSAKWPAPGGDPLALTIDRRGCRRNRTISKRGRCWPYYAGNRSRLEPTAWASLAQTCRDGSSDAARAYFAQCQRGDGLFVDRSAPVVNFAFHALAVIASVALDFAASPSSLHRAVGAIVRERGIRIPFERQYYQNNHLQGWSWCPDTFSWVEPTAWSILALKKAAAQVPESLRAAISGRISDGERSLFNRACVGGGWNYGNANMYAPRVARARADHRYRAAGIAGLSSGTGGVARPFVPSTAPPRGTHRHVAGTRSRCASVVREPADDIHAALPAAAASGAARSHVQSMAMVLYALAAFGDRYPALRL